MQQASDASDRSALLWADAETSICLAIHIAENQHAGLLALRATVNLGRLLQVQNRQSEAADQLHKAICRLNGKGSGTHDVKDAESLLKALSTRVQTDAEGIRNKSMRP